MTLDEAVVGDIKRLISKTSTSTPVGKNETPEQEETLSFDSESEFVQEHPTVDLPYC